MFGLFAYESSIGRRSVVRIARPAGPTLLMIVAFQPAAEYAPGQISARSVSQLPVPQRSAEPNSIRA
jgi:hypothetical protein